MVKGDFINAGGTFNAGSETVTFNGTSVQNIGGTSTTTFSNLTFDNSNGINLSTPVNVSGALTLINGKVVLGNNHLSLGENATIQGTPSVSAMIVPEGTGELRKFFNSGSGLDPFTFPVGDNTGTAEYSPVTIDFTSATFASGAYISLRLENAKHPELSSDYTTYLNRNWTIEPSGITNYDYNINLFYVNNDVILGTQNQSDLVPIKKSGFTWYQPNGSTFTDAVSQGTYTYTSNNCFTWNGLSSFSQFGAAGNRLGPLPVVLSNFTALCKQQKIQLNWSTQSELNNDYFTIERSKDGSLFNEVGRVNGNGTTNLKNTYQFFDELAYQGTSYYRLSQHDFNGATKVYPIKTVSCTDEQNLFSIYPNPNNGTFEISGLNEGNEVVITDMLGKKVGSLQNKSSNEIIQLNTLKPGVYFVEIKDAAGTLTIQKVIIEY